MLVVRGGARPFAKGKQTIATKKQYPISCFNLMFLDLLFFPRESSSEEISLHELTFWSEYIPLYVQQLSFKW